MPFIGPWTNTSVRYCLFNCAYTLFTEKLEKRNKNKKEIVIIMINDK